MGESTLYYRHEDGSVSSQITTRAATEVAARPGAVAITKSVFDKALAKIEAANAELVAVRRLGEARQRSEDYDALLAAGIPAATASRLSGHTLADA
ncbi:hypothetical protein GCM10010387_15350 [Streptomyces inusitatus]|uniref:Uncharacterized protein n=1 Tax=Streptomyces inusitatus TaxID=68221 RepID=A0A918PUA2_9ACTN|nr:hypothetical protein [Streptomyces inusitatus]GGZ23174.1 hypothetical protein GCM10010387_15350 [Streptomyces inusitatus]